jgi:hypothetical protein
MKLCCCGDSVLSCMNLGTYLTIFGLNSQAKKCILCDKEADRVFNSLLIHKLHWKSSDYSDSFLSYGDEVYERDPLY